MHHTLFKEKVWTDWINLNVEHDIHCKKKISDFSVPSQDVTNQTLPGRDLIISGQGEFG
jgi:hypothetical protein